MYETLSEMREKLRRKVPGFTITGYNDAVQDTYSNLVREYPWVELEEEFTLQVLASISTGGADFNSGATSITAATTVSAAWTDGTSDGFAGRFIKKANESAYWLITASDTVEITITSNYLGTSTTAVASAGDGYFIFKHIYAVNSAIDTVERLMYHESLIQPLDDEQIERRDPDLDGTGEVCGWRNAGINSAGVSMVQIYPAQLNDNYLLRGRGRIRVETLTDTTKPLIDSNLIIAYAEVELLGIKKLMNNDSVPDMVLQLSLARANRLLDTALRSNTRKHTFSRYVKDRFHSPNRSHQWYVEYGG